MEFLGDAQDPWAPTQDCLGLHERNDIACDYCSRRDECIGFDDEQYE